MIDDPPQSRSVALRLVIDPGEPMAGTVLVDDGRSEQTRFCGWIELMSAITAARAEPPSPL